MNRLIITGFARSGTSLLAGFFKKLGYDVGGIYNKEIDAGWEDEQFQKIVTTFQSNPLGEELILFLEKEITKMDKIVVKHPRMLFVPELLRIWTYIFPDTRILVTYREPYHALQSKNKEGNLGYFSNISPAELNEKFNKFIKILIELRIKHHILYFPNFTENYEEVYHAISSLGIHIDQDKGRNIWNNLVDFTKIHYK